MCYCMHMESNPFAFRAILVCITISQTVLATLATDEDSDCSSFGHYERVAMNIPGQIMWKNTCSFLVFVIGKMHV